MTNDISATKALLAKMADEWISKLPTEDERRAVYWFLRFSGYDHEQTKEFSPPSDAYTKAVMAMKFSERVHEKKL